MIKFIIDFPQRVYHWTKWKKYSFWFLNWLFIFSFFLPNRLQANTVSLDQLEAIVQKAGSVQEFLADKDLRDEYYSAIKNYYGFSKKRFPKKNFNIFLSQLKKLVKESKKFASAIWSTDRPLGVKHFVRASSPKSFYLDRERLLKFWNKFQKESLEVIQSEFPSFNFEKFPETVFQYLENLSSEIDRFQVSIQGMGRKRKSFAQSQFFEELKSRPKTKAALLAYALFLLERKSLSQRLQDISPSELIEVLSGLSHVSEKGHPLPKAFRQLVGVFMPKKEQLLKEKVLVYQAQSWHKGLVSSGTYVFHPVSRPIHAIFKGVCHEECVGEGGENI